MQRCHIMTLSEVNFMDKDNYIESVKIVLEKFSNWEILVIFLQGKLLVENLTKTKLLQHN